MSLIETLSDYNTFSINMKCCVLIVDVLRLIYQDPIEQENWHRDRNHAEWHFVVGFLEICLSEASYGNHFEDRINDGFLIILLNFR